MMKCITYATMEKLRLSAMLLPLLFMVAVTAQGQNRSLESDHFAPIKWYASNTTSSANHPSVSKVYGKTISLSFYGVALEAVLKAIAQKADLRLAYDKKQLANHTVTFVRGNLTVIEAFEGVLKGTGLEVLASPNGQVVIIKRAKKLAEPVVQAEAVSGTVTDASTGETLPGVNIRVKGTTTGTSTDSEGHYEVEVPSLQDTLVFSFVGYQTRQVPINGKSVIDVSLKSKTISGEEMVVIGYGTTSRKNLAGSVSKVEGEELTDIPASSVDQVLEGRAAGVQVTRTSGAPGSGSMIRIRGGNSINGNNDPLYVIDGYVAGKFFNLNNIDADNIKSIDILKGPTAVGIYGTRGSNGVIQITTKNGVGLKPGSPQVTFSSYIGTQSLQNSVDLANGREQAKYANASAEFRSAAIPFPDLNKVPNTDWIDVSSQKAPLYRGNISISGVTPDQSINYFVSGSYYNEQGIIKNSGIRKYIFRANTDIKLSDYVKTGARFNIARNYQNNNKVNFSDLLTRGPLSSRAIYNDKGEYTAYNPVSGSIRQNAKARIDLIDNHNYVTNLLLQAYLQVEPIKNLVLKTTFAPEIRSLKADSYYPSTLPNLRVVNKGGHGGVSVDDYTNLQNQNTVNYITDLNVENHLELLGGFTWTIHQAEGVTARAEGFASDIAKYNNLETGSDPARNFAGSSWGSYQLVSWFGRARYIFRDKYILTLVGREDGSSRFSSANKQYAFFPSIAAAWRLSQEPFIKKLNVFNNLKFKASYGISGSQGISSFRTLPILNGLTTVFNDQKQSGVILGRPANPELGWEKTKELDFGLSAGFFGGRLSIDAEYYHKITEDLLLNVQIPRQTGFTSRLENLGSIKNNGLELSVTSDNIVSDDFQWTTSLNISGNRSEVLDLGGVDYINIAFPTNQGGPGGRLVIGKPAPVFVGVKYLGTWKSQEEIDVSGQVGQDVGGAHFKDTNEDGQITEEDFKVLGSPQPDFYGGIGNTISYKNIALDIFFQGSYGNNIFNGVTQTGFFTRGEKVKYAETVENMWTPNNRDSNVPRAGTAASLSEIKNNSEEVEDGSYLRLKNVKLIYNLPVAKMGLTGFKRLSIYLSGTNLMLLDNFRLFDPETNQYGSSNVAIGFSHGEYPYPRTLTLGIRAAL